MKLKTLALACMLIGLSGCQLTTPVDVAAKTILVSAKIDAMQTDIGTYLDAKVAFEELDNLQEDLLDTFTTGSNPENILSYQVRAKIIYNTFVELLTKEKWDSLSAVQQANLVDIDNDLIALNTAMDEMTSSTGISDELLAMVYQATTLMLYYKVI